MPWVGIIYVLSLVGLTLVVASVYSAAQEAFAPLRVLARQTLRRSLKLLGVLGILAVMVHFFSRI